MFNDIVLFPLMCCRYLRLITDLYSLYRSSPSLPTAPDSDPLLVSFLSTLCTHHAVVVDQLQLVLRQDVRAVVDQVQGELSAGQTGLTPGPAAAHGEERSDVQLLLPCGVRRAQQQDQDRDQNRDQGPGREEPRREKRHSPTRNRSVQSLRDQSVQKKTTDQTLIIGFKAFHQHVPLQISS